LPLPDGEGADILLSEEPGITGREMDSVKANWVRGSFTRPERAGRREDARFTDFELFLTAYSGDSRFMAWCEKHASCATFEEQPHGRLTPFFAQSFRA
jgi:hypothetical protein